MSKLTPTDNRRFQWMGPFFKTLSTVTVAIWFFSPARELNADGTKNKYKHLPYEEKIKPERGLTFRLTFDKFSVVADYAKGEASPIQGGDIELGLRGKLGYDDANAFVREKGEILKYSVPNNINLQEGTIICWIQAENYDPSKREEDKHKGYVAVQFKNGGEWIRFFIYHFWTGQTAHFYWNNSSKPKDDHGVAAYYLNDIKKGEWFQIAATWNEEEIRTYLNGELHGQRRLPAKAAETANLKPDPKESWISVRGYSRDILPPDDKSDKTTLIDDISVYDYAMPARVIKAKYLSVVNTDEKVEPPPPVCVACVGVDRGDGKLGDVELKMDFNSLPDKFYDQLKKNGLKVEYELTNRISRRKRSGKWTVADPVEKRILSLGEDGGGDYSLKLTMTAPDDSKISVEKEIDVPDMSFAGNSLGKDGGVPAPWEPVTMSDDHVVSVWNRKYDFDGGPFPSNVEVAGKSVLKEAPKLIIETPEGLAKIDYSITGTRVNDERAEIRGVGKAKGFTIRYKTAVEFDGLIDTEFIVEGSPEISSMKIMWIVAPEFAEFFLTPFLRQDEKEEYPFPSLDRKCVRQLWFASDAGGFCWSPVSDANWVYEPGEKVMKIDRTQGGARCELDLITRKVKIPPGAPYRVLFIATPTRPAPREIYGFFMGPTHGKGTDKHLVSVEGEGQIAFGEFTPDPIDFPDFVKDKKPNSLAIYNFATGLTESSPTGVFYSKYWNFPEMCFYNMWWRHRGERTRTRTINCCPATCYADFILYGIKNLLDHEYGDRVWAIYYDLCGINFCKNQRHGCEHNDKFGRLVFTNNVLSLRELLKRTTRYCHQRGRSTIYHAQNTFNPMAHAFGDYWYGGEQFGGMTAANTFAYTDDISDDIYRSELNRRVLGSTLLLLPALHKKKENLTTEAGEAFACQLLLHDIPTSSQYMMVQTQNPHQVLVKLHKVFDEYDIDNAISRRYYEQGQITSSNPDVKVTYYVCPKGRSLIVLANRTKRPVETEIDVSKLRDGDFTTREEYRDEDVAVKNGKFQVTVPSRSFNLIGM